jgi:hypothetical protein
VIASPLRPWHRQESGIAAAGQLAHQGTPYGASLSFATTTHLWPLSDPPHGSPRSAKQPHWGPPGQFRAAPLPRQCRVPPVRVPGQDSHLRSQTSVPGTPASRRPTGAGSTTTGALASHQAISHHQHQQHPTPGWATSSHRAGASASHRFYKTLTRAAAAGRVRGATRVGRAWRFAAADLALDPPSVILPTPAPPGRARESAGGGAAAAIRAGGLTGG